MATGLSRTDHVTLCALVRLVDAALAAPAPLDDPVTRTRIDATAKHARALLDPLLAAAPPPPHASSSTLPRDSPQDLDARLSRAELRLAHLASAPRPPSSSLSDATPATPDPLDVAFLKRLPDITPYAFPPSPDADPDPLAPTEDKENDAPEDAKGKKPRRSTVADPPDDRPSSPSASAASSRAPTPSVPSSPSRRSGSTPLESLAPAGGMRQRARRKPAAAAGGEGDVPAYLAAKRNKGKAREERAEDEAERARRAREALLPSDLAPAAAGGGEAASDLVSQHHAVQASLLSSLTSLSGALKNSASEFGDRLARDRDVLERAQEQLEKNEQGMGAQQARLKDVRGKSRGTTCWTLALLAAVAVLWVLVFLLIKVTSIRD